MKKSHFLKSATIGACLILVASALAAPVTKTAPYPLDVGYIVDLPDRYDNTKQYPLIVVLHGFGDRMSSYEGFAKLLWPEGAIGLYPESPFPFSNDKQVGWTWVFRGDSLSTVSEEKSRDASIDWILKTIELVKKEYPVDPTRVFLTGFSQGGMLTYTIGLAHPELFAGLIPIGGFLTVPVDSLHPLSPQARAVPMLILHGVNDDIVPFKSALEAEAKLKEAGMDIRLHRYPARHQITSEMTDDARDFIMCRLHYAHEGSESPAPGQTFDILNRMLCSAQPIADREAALFTFYAQNESTAVRERIVYLFGARRSADAETLLVRVLQDKTQPQNLRQASYTALVKLATPTAWQTVARTPRQLAILEVVAAGPGEKAGLKPGDVILRYNGRTVVDNQGLRSAMSRVKSNQKAVPMIILRQDKQLKKHLAPGRIGVRLQEQVR